MHSIAWWPTLFVAIVATITDLRSRRIPNWLVIPFLVLGMVVCTISGGWPGLGRSFLGALIGSLALGIFCLVGGMGMGDVKLFAAMGAWIGPHQLVFAFIFMGLTGGLMALAWSIRGGFFRASLSGSADLIFGLPKRGLRPHPTLTLTNQGARPMPYAPAIAVGTILSFLAVG